MKSCKDIEKLITKHVINPRSEMRSNILDEALQIHKNQEQPSISSTKLDIWKIVMTRRITKCTAAAIMIIAIIVGVKYKYTQRSDMKKEDRVVTASLFVELKQIRQMATASDVSGLIKMLSVGQLESKLVAANALNKMVDIPALVMLTMHVSGDIVIDCQEGSLRLYSTNSEDWLEIINGALEVHANETIHTTGKVRLTHDVSGDPGAWDRRQSDFRGLHHEQDTLKEQLDRQNEFELEDKNELKERLEKCNEILDSLEEAIYATIDERGRLLLNSPFRKKQASIELYNGKVRVESSHGHVVEADSVTLLMELRPVRTDGPPLPTTGWRSRFDQVYSLDDGEVLRWIRTPFMPERQIYATQELHYYSGTDNPPPPGYLYFRWDGKLRNWTLAMDRCSLSLVLDSIGLKRYEYSDESEKLNLIKLGGDWIARDNVPIEDRLLALERILQNELGRTIRFEKRKVNRDVIIVRGQYKQVPLEGVKKPNKIYVYTDLWEDFPGPEPDDGGGTGSVVELIETVGSHFNRPVVFETENLSDITVSYVTSLSYSLATANAKTKEDKQEILDSVMQNLSRQSSLQLEYGQRDIDVWFISEEN